MFCVAARLHCPGNRMTYRIGADIGGTFTDVVMHGEDGQTWTAKVLSTVDDFSRGIAEATAELIDIAGITPSEITEVVHGTTVATNSILEEKGAKTALVTTAGFRDVLELRRLRVPELFSLFYRPPRPLVARRLRFEVTERIGSRGEVVTPLDIESVDAVIEQLLAAQPESVAVCLLHSYANTRHERMIGERIVKALPSAFVTLSVDVLPEIREYERTSTTVINAYIGPIVADYVKSLGARLEAAGVRGQLRIMRSDGGVMTANATLRTPAQIIESGPAAGVVAAAALGARTGRPDLIAFDMGGTTAKAALVEDGRPSWTTEYEVGAGITLSNRLVKGSGHALRLPVIDLAEVGSGGGSIVTIDPGGAMKVGPESAGSSPGPACYALGGKQATVTDADVVLGYLNQGALAGGALKIDAAEARRAIGSVAPGSGDEDLLATAFGVHEIANATMVRAIKAVTTYRGRDPRQFLLLAFGGSGPVHAAHIARSLGISQVVVPPSPGVFSAVGLLQAAPEFHFTRTCLLDAGTDDLAVLRDVFDSLESDARAALIRDGFDAAPVTWQRLADARFTGQSSELTVQLPESFGWEQIIEEFTEEHRKTYGHADPRASVQVVNARVKATVQGSGYVPSLGEDLEPVQNGPQRESRQAYFGSSAGLMETPVLRRADVSDASINGPVIIDEMDATTVVPPGCSVRLDDSGSLLIKVGQFE